MAVSDATALTQRFRAQQARRAALIAALVSIYLRNKVNIEDPRAVERWLALMIPKVLEEHDLLAQAAARYGNQVRKLEVGKTSLPFEFEPVRAINEFQIRGSLMAVGVNSYRRKVADIRRLDEKQFDPSVKQAMINDANEVASARVAGSVARLAQNGARSTIEDGAKNDPLTIGYVRVTKADPCSFCAMLASRGLEGGIYQSDSFELSDPRFQGDGTAKVHDSCGCSLKPVYTRQDGVLKQNEKYDEMWKNFSGKGDADMLTNFRRNYEGREAYLKK